MADHSGDLGQRVQLDGQFTGKTCPECGESVERCGETLDADGYLIREYFSCNGCVHDWWEDVEEVPYSDDRA